MGGGAPGASGAQGREARVQQPESAAGSLELLRPGSAANVSTGQTPPRGSADSARSGEGGRRLAAASGRPFHAPESAAPRAARARSEAGSGLAPTLAGPETPARGLEAWGDV